MEKLTVKNIEGLNVTGVDNDGIEVVITKVSRLESLKVGDQVQGYFLNDDDNLDEFYFEAVSIVQ